MAAFACPKCDALSTDAEFCSDCGASMQAVSPAAAALVAADMPEGDSACPACGEKRLSKAARFCDTCRYDFLTRQPFSVAAEPLAAPPPAPPPPPPASAPRVAQRWDLRALVDLSWRRAEDPMPSDQRERLFPLDLSEHLIGRRSDGEDIHPEIALTDPGISRRHARITRAADGTLALIDYGSMNGTKLNGTAVEAHVPTPLADGDAITLGIWTRLIVMAR